MEQIEDMQSHDYLVSHLRQLLKQYEGQSPRMSLREQTKLMVRIQEATRNLGIAIGVRAGFSPKSAKARILSYLQESANQVLDGLELAAISGISEYARRVREIRVEGLNIMAGPEGKDPKTGKDLLPSQYILVSDRKAEADGPFLPRK